MKRFFICLLGFAFFFEINAEKYKILDFTEACKIIKESVLFCETNSSSYYIKNFKSNSKIKKTEFGLFLKEIFHNYKPIILIANNESATDIHCYAVFGIEEALNILKIFRNKNYRVWLYYKKNQEKISCYQRIICKIRHCFD